MIRREFMNLAAGFAGAAFVPSLVPSVSAQAPGFRATAIEGWRRRIKSILAKGGLPILDVEGTYLRGRTDVAQLAFAAADEETSAASLELYREYPEFFVPTASSGETARWWDNPVGFVDGVKRDLATGNYFLMGEHEFRHYPSPEQVKKGRWDRDVTVPIDGVGGQALFRLSEETGIAFQIHYDLEDVLFPPLESMLAKYPRARVIWCHLGQMRYPDRARKYNSAYVRSLIERFPLLHFDLAVPGPRSVYIPSGARQSTIYSSGKLDMDWRQLMEDHPTRFLSASDTRPAVQENYPLQIGRQRKLILAALSERASHLVAYGNAWRLITGEDWKA
jgi:hypothetical protein